jgi:flagellar biosynthesis/type III secretory pathway protein FliH
MSENNLNNKVAIVGWMYDFLNPNDQKDVIRNWISQDYSEIKNEKGFNIRPLVDISSHEKIYNKLNDIEKALKEYSLEICPNFPLTVDALIESHRSLREANKKRWDEYRDYRKQGYDTGYNEGLKIATSGDYVKVNKLKWMTLSELVNLIDN